MAQSQVTEFSDQREILAMRRTALIFEFYLEGNLQGHVSPGKLLCMLMALF